MKTTLWRVLALCLSIVMIVGCFAGCDKDSGDDASKYSSVQEEGSEEELTAVRENLIKLTETQGFGEIDKMEYYENGVRTTSDQYVQVKDNKKVYYSGDKKRVVNYTDGYILDMPADWKPDYSMSSLRVRYDSDEASLIVSHETGVIGASTFYKTGEEYIATIYRFLKDPKFQLNNGVTKISEPLPSEVDGYTCYVYKAKLENCPEGTKCFYTYVDLISETGNLYHMMFKAVDDRDFAEVYESFKAIYDKGAAIDTLLYPCENNPNWAPETKEHYEALREQETIDWGLFAYKLETTGWDINIPMLEKKLDFKFPIISQYYHYTGDVDKEPMNMAFVNECLEDGRMMQITYQYTLCNNEDLTFQSPALDIYRGTEESKQILTKFAESCASIGQPFYFRLNNEMNTDWTSYCGLANMLDPDIYIESWIKLYDIFTETGANQYAMWVFNAFDGSYPPVKFMNYRNYMPKAEYIDMIGLTGYNTPKEAGAWQSYEQIYDKICNEYGYSEYFGDWPWIISEFGCGVCEGCSKPEWITGMFDNFADGKYPNIKVAIWFSCNDYMDGQVTNELVLDKDPEVIEAFKAGLELTQ
ncbi:MAG: hypothetical protein IJC52_02565 [Clostridia bacterium]|nr:hypothetical protein [Clostridia bacterium]